MVVEMVLPDVFGNARRQEFPGHVAACQLRPDSGCGHGHRRHLEQDDGSGRRVRQRLAASVVQEPLDQRERKETFDVLDRQIKAGLDGFTGDQVATFVIAYEPVWAIGTGRNAAPEQAGEAHAHIRQRLRAWFGGPAADGCHILYGGSVKPENVAAIAAQPEVDGALVGGASLDPAVFYEILRGAAVVRP